MLGRFVLYSILKNLRFFEPFFVLYLLADRSMGGAQLDFLQIGLLLGYQKALTGLLEIPFGVLTDRFGRRRALALGFGGYTIAFPIYAHASALPDQTQLAALYLAQTLFGLAEALRTGSHKAIMLDWAERTGRADQSTRILGLTRFFSKTSAGTSGLIGGTCVYLSGSMSALFWAATLPALLGVALMVSYPRWLDGEMSRSDQPGSRPRLRERLRRIASAPGLWTLILGSLVFESQIKLAQQYLQPFLKLGLAEEDVAIVGAFGALLIGVYYLVQDVLGGLASAAAAPLEERIGDRWRANLGVHVAATGAMAILVLCMLRSWLAVGAMGFVLLAALQNVRRPIFVAELNTRMDKAQRATVLSIESQARSFAFAVLAPITGWLADTGGLSLGLLAIAATLGLGLLPLVLSSSWKPTTPAIERRPT